MLPPDVDATFGVLRTTERFRVATLVDDDTKLKRRRTEKTTVRTVLGKATNICDLALEKPSWLAEAPDGAAMCRICVARAKRVQPMCC